MSTLKHKEFIQSRKRNLLLSEDEKKGMLCVGEDDSLFTAVSETQSSDDNGLSTKPDKFIEVPSSKQSLSVCFSNTIDLINKPYLPDQTDAETLDRFHNDIWYTRDDYRMFYRDRLETVRLWRSLRSMEHRHQQQHHYGKLELRGLEQYQSSSVSAKLNQQRAEYTEAVLRAAWERRQLLQQSNGNHDTALACENMIRDRVKPLSLLAVERAKYLAAQDAKEVWKASNNNNDHHHHHIDEVEEKSRNRSRGPMEEGEQSPTKRSKRCMSPPESPQSILDLQLLDSGCINSNNSDIHTHSFLSASSCSITDEQQLNERDSRLQKMKQGLVQYMVDAPPTPMIRSRGTFRHGQQQQDMRMPMTTMMSAPSTPMSGRRTVASEPEAWNDMMGAPTPMHRRSTVRPFQAVDGGRNNMMSASSSSSSPSTPIMNGRHTIPISINSAAPLTPTMVSSRSTTTKLMMKHSSSPYHLSSCRSHAGINNKDFDRYMASAQQLLDQQHHDIRRRSLSSSNNNMLMLPQDCNNNNVSHHDLLLRQDSLAMGINYHNHHHQKQQNHQHNNEHRRVSPMGPLVEQDASHMRQHSFFLQQQQTQHDGMRHLASSPSSSSGCVNSMGAMHGQYEAMRRSSLGGLNDSLDNLRFHNTCRSHLHDLQLVQPKLPSTMPQDRSEFMSGMPTVANFASMRDRSCRETKQQPSLFL